MTDSEQKGRKMAKFRMQLTGEVSSPIVLGANVEIFDEDRFLLSLHHFCFSFFFQRTFFVIRSQTTNMYHFFVSICPTLRTLLFVEKSISTWIILHFYYDICLTNIYRNHKQRIYAKFTFSKNNSGTSSLNWVCVMMMKTSWWKPVQSI